MELPSPESFLADAGIPMTKTEEEREKERVSHAQAQRALQDAGVSQEFMDLLTQYCSQFISAHELEQVDWRALANRLGTAPEFLKEAAEVCNANGLLWAKVLQDRIRRASAAKIFRDSSWERLEALAVNRLVTLAEKNLIKDPGELLAVASHARRATEAKQGAGAGGGMTVNIGLGGESMDGNNGLPAAGTTMRIELTPRLAQSLSQRQERPEGRVIDGQMLSAAELRTALDSQNKPKTEPSPDGDMFEGDDQ